MSEDASDAGADSAEGGDAACWLHLTCPECGAVVEPPGAASCWRCGVSLREE